jgi:hypothetical protein
MDTLYSWQARRSGAKITLFHSCGKIPGVDKIGPNENGQIVAVKGEQAYYLATPPHLHADYVNAGVSDLFFNYEEATGAYGKETDYEQARAMIAAAESFRVMLGAAGIAPPSAAALIADFHKRV